MIHLRRTTPVCRAILLENALFGAPRGDLAIAAALAYPVPKRKARMIKPLECASCHAPLALVALLFVALEAVLVWAP
jgi:hypothetical protein